MHIHTHTHTHTHTHQTSASARVVNQLLTEMDGLETRKQVFIMAATNRPGNECIHLSHLPHLPTITHTPSHTHTHVQHTARTHTHTHMHTHTHTARTHTHTHTWSFLKHMCIPTFCSATYLYDHCYRWRLFTEKFEYGYGCTLVYTLIVLLTFLTLSALTTAAVYVYMSVQSAPFRAR